MGPERVHMASSSVEGERRFLLRRPKALQYFHGGELRKAGEGERQAGRFELFLDLLCESSSPIAGGGRSLGLPGGEGRDCGKGLEELVVWRIIGPWSMAWCPSWN